MAIIVVEDILEYLKQVQEKADQDDFHLLEKIAARANSIVEGYLGLEYGEYDEEAEGTELQVISYGTPYLTLPAHQAGSVTEVKDPSGAVITSTLYSAQPDGTLFMAGSGIYYPYLWPRPSYPFGYTGVWAVGVHTVTAVWGSGPAPDNVVQVTLEVAVNLWRGKDRGMWTENIGVEGEGGIRFTGGLLSQQRAILDSIKLAERVIV